MFILAEIRLTPIFSHLQAQTVDCRLLHQLTSSVVCRLSIPLDTS